MEIRSTFILSLLLHITFSALLLFSAGFQAESGKLPAEKVFFVDLKADVEKPMSVVTTKLSSKKTAVNRIRKETAVITEKRKPDVEITLKDSMSVKKETDFMESLSTDPAVTPIVPGGTDKLFYGERMEDTNLAQAGEEIIPSVITSDAKRGGLYKADALKLITAAIEKVKTYPALARKREIEGTVYVSFMIRRGGEPDEIRVLKSSGYRILDVTTLEIVKKAAPYPYIDEQVEVPVTYRLND